MNVKNKDTIVVSIRLMTYNHSDFIIEALDGIDKQQTNFKFEVVIGDDFSTDDNLKKINNFVFLNKNISVNILKRERGDAYDRIRKERGRLYNFTNIIEKCKGKYIALLDGDDYWTDPLKLQKQVDFLEGNPNLVGCFHNTICVDENSTIIAQQYFKKTDKKQYTQEDCLKVLHSSYSTAALVFKANAIQGQLELFSKIGSDFILDIFITNHGDLYYLDENMSAYRIHAGGIWQGSTDVYNLKVILERFLFLYNTKLYRQKYNDYLWSSILKYYESIIKLTKNNKERKKAILQKYCFLNYLEFRTYLFLLKKNKLPFYYRFKKLTSKNTSS